MQSVGNRFTGLTFGGSIPEETLLYHSDEPEQMTPEARDQEVAGILATGFSELKE